MKNLRKPHKQFTLNGKSFENGKELLTFSKIVSNTVHSFLRTWFDDSDAIAVSTSGSTGKPKIIYLKKEYMVNSALATGAYFKIFEDTKALLCLSPDYIAGKMMLVRAIVLGWQLDIVEPTSNPLAFTKKSYDFCAMVPLQVENSLNELYKIKKVLVGGAPVSTQLIAKIKDVPTEVFATYGMTETITHIAVKRLNHHQHTASGFPAPPKTHTLKEPYFNVLPTVKISTDPRNCLVIDAPKVSDKQIITNDIVELVSDTKFRWLGRYDTVINSGGIKLIPELIEKKLAQLIKQRFFVAGISDEQLGEKLVLIIENKNNILNKKYIQDLNSQLSTLNSLDKYEVPKTIYTVKQFVETPTKKIQRQQTLDLIF